jgi:hypothetical protein
VSRRTAALVLPLVTASALVVLALARQGGDRFLGHLGMALVCIACLFPITLPVLYLAGIPLARPVGALAQLDDYTAWWNYLVWAMAAHLVIVAAYHATAVHQFLMAFTGRPT